MRYSELFDPRDESTLRQMAIYTTPAVRMVGSFPPERRFCLNVQGPLMALLIFPRRRDVNSVAVLRPFSCWWYCLVCGAYDIAAPFDSSAIAQLL